MAGEDLGKVVLCDDLVHSCDEYTSRHGSEAIGVFIREKMVVLVRTVDF